MCTGEAAEQLAGTLRARVEEAGLSLRQVAARSRLSLGTVEAIAAGAFVSPRRDTVMKLARGLGVSADVLLSATAVEVPAARAATEPLAEALLRLRSERVLHV